MGGGVHLPESLKFEGKEKCDAHLTSRRQLNNEVLGVVDMEELVYTYYPVLPCKLERVLILGVRFGPPREKAGDLLASATTTCVVYMSRLPR